MRKILTIGRTINPTKTMSAFPEKASISIKDPMTIPV